jgi:hypothetical protein
MCKETLEIGQIAEGASDARQFLCAYLHDRRWFGVEHARARIAACGHRDEYCAGGCEVLYDSRVERFPGAVSQGVGDIASP